MNEKRATEWGEKLRALLGKKNAVMLLGIAGIALIGLSELWSDSAARAAQPQAQTGSVESREENLEAHLAQLLREGWEQKKRTSSIVTNTELEQIIAYSVEHGAEAVKLSGAGGGGFILLYCDPVNRQQLFEALKQKGGIVFPVKFSKCGAESWVAEE